VVVSADATNQLAAEVFLSVWLTARMLPIARPLPQPSWQVQDTRVQ